MPRTKKGALALEELSATSSPRLLATHRIHWEETIGSYALLYPEGLVYITEQESRVLQLCDGTHQVREILQAEMSRDSAENAAKILLRALQKGWLE